MAIKLSKTVATHVEVHTMHRGVITAADIRRAFDLPEHANIIFQVPGGADWSNERLNLNEHELEVFWETVETKV